MKNFLLFAGVGSFALLTSCEKPLSDAERNAQVEREVQQRLAAEHQTAQQQQLAQQQTDLATREQALADREAAANQTPAAGLTVAQETVAEERTSTPRPRVNQTTTSAAAEEEAPTTYDTFYRKLEPLGAWRETTDYGYVWQPEQAQRSRDWRPYTEGRWAYTDAGWTWVSEEPFGWATYHYGRWTHLRGVGWCWVPGEQWAPAWVSWRTSNQYVGWAPLPPEAHFDRQRGIQRWADSYYDIDAGEYVFIPNEAIGSRQIQREVVPVEQNVTIVTQTTNVTNITYNNTIVINQGPNFDELRARSRQPIERLRLERRTDAGADPRAVVRGDVLAVSTPVFAAQATERPHTSGEAIRDVTVERNFGTNVNQADAERARQKMKTETAPPADAPPKRYQKPTFGPRPAAAATATPAESVATKPAIPNPSPSAMASPSPTAVATSSPRPIASPSATVAPGSPRPSGPKSTPAQKPSATIAPMISATPAAKATPTATIAPIPTASPRASFPKSTPRPTATASPVISATPLASATPVPPLSTPAPRLRPSVAPRPSVVPEETPLTTPSALRKGAPIAPPAASSTPPPPRIAPPRISPPPAPDASPTANDAEENVNPRHRGPGVGALRVPPPRAPAARQPMNPDARPGEPEDPARPPQPAGPRPRLTPPPVAPPPAATPNDPAALDGAASIAPRMIWPAGHKRPQPPAPGASASATPDTAVNEPGIGANRPAVGARDAKHPKRAAAEAAAAAAAAAEADASATPTASPEAAERR